MTPEQLAIVIAGIAVVVVALVGAGGAIVVKVIQENTKIQKANVESRAELADAQRKATVAQNQMPEQVGQKIDQYLAPILTIYVEKTNELTARIDALNAAHAQTKQDLAAAHTDRQSLATELAKVQKRADDLEKKVVGRDERITSLEHDLGETKQELERVKTDKDLQLIAANRTIADLQEKLLTAQNEMGNYKAGMETLKERVRVLEEQVAHMKAERDAIIQERDEALSQVELLKTQLEAAAERESEQNQRLVALRAELAALKAAPVASITSADPVIASTEAPLA